MTLKRRWFCEWLIRALKYTELKKHMCIYRRQDFLYRMDGLKALMTALF